ncbi:MAG: endonuclease [Bacteroidetes bacterium]|nr:endonuclease [Bacteroidota bacterium]
MQIMTEKPNHEQRAYSAWKILTEVSFQRGTITYGDLAKLLNIHPRPIRIILGIIYDHCVNNNLPPLTILVLNKLTGLPGSGFTDYDPLNPQKVFDFVYDFNWRIIENPFEYARTGTNQNELASRLLNFPDQSADVFAQVKVRGIQQRIFRQALLKAYKYSCAMCGFSFPEALEACHIIPYSECGPAQKLDIKNGLLLCSTHHKLFDKGYITVNNNYSIDYFDMKEEEGKHTEYDRLMTINLHSKKLNLPKDINHLPDAANLEIHRKLWIEG